MKAARLKLIKIDRKIKGQTKDLQEFISATQPLSAFAFVARKPNGQIALFSSETSLLELCGLLAYLEADIKSRIET